MTRKVASVCSIRSYAVTIAEMPVYKITGPEFGRPRAPPPHSDESRRDRRGPRALVTTKPSRRTQLRWHSQSLATLHSQLRSRRMTAENTHRQPATIQGPTRAHQALVVAATTQSDTAQTFPGRSKDYRVCVLITGDALFVSRHQQKFASPCATTSC